MQYADRPLQDRLVLGRVATSPASSATRTGIADLLHAHGALSFWDFAAAAPYVDIEMNRDCAEHPRCHKDAIFLSPAQVHRRARHARRARRAARAADATACPTCPAAAPSPTSTRSSTATSTTRRTARRAARRRSSSRSAPGWCSSSRTRSASTRSAPARTHFLQPRGRRPGATHPRIEILGNLDAERLSIVSFVVRRPAERHGYLHHNFVVALLNDLFGIQSRGGCSCAGPYGHRLLGIDLERSHEFEREIARGCEGIKPGWVRVNFNYFISEAVFDYIVDAVRLVAEHGWRLLPDYRFDPATGLWRHRDGPVEPPLRLARSATTTTASMTLPAPRRPARPSRRCAGYLDEAGRVFAWRREAAAAADLPETERRCPASRRLRAPALVRAARGLPHALSSPFDTERRNPGCIHRKLLRSTPTSRYVGPIDRPSGAAGGTWACRSPVGGHSIAGEAKEERVLPMRTLPRPVRRRRSAIAAAGALLLGASLMTATAASAADDPRVGLAPGYLDRCSVAASNIELLATTPRVAPFDAAPGNFGFVNSDLAFTGDNAIVGNFNGFQVYDVSDPAAPTLRASFVCPGGQGDVSVYGDLLFMSVEETRGRIDCGTQGAPGAVNPERFRGVRIFDISDIDNPVQLPGVQTLSRVAHAHARDRPRRPRQHLHLQLGHVGRAARPLSSRAARTPRRPPPR